MREILFRGQTRRYGEKVYMSGEKLPGKWVCGGICHGSGDFSIIYGSTDPDDISACNIEKHVVYTNTVGQFTGLRDKDSNRIFEGDIVDCNGHEQVVVWDYQYLNALDGRICGSDWTVRVVGNIHAKEGA